MKKIIYLFFNLISIAQAEPKVAEPKITEPEIINVTADYKVVALVVKLENGEIDKVLLIKGEKEHLWPEKFLKIMVNGFNNKDKNYFLLMMNDYSKFKDSIRIADYPLEDSEGRRLARILEFSEVVPPKKKL